MKRLALALAATVLGACGGGGSHPPPATGGAILYWDFVRNAPAQTGGAVVYDATLTGTGDAACPESAVEQVTIDAPGLAQVTLPCIYQGVQGVELDGLLAGTNTIRVRGWRGAYAVYDGSFSVSVQGNAAPAQSYLDVPAAQSPIEVYAYLYTSDTSQYYASCASALDPVVEYDVWDSFGTLVLSAAVACQDPADPFPVIVQGLDLDNYTIRMQGLDGTTRLFDSCTSEAAKLLAFDHFGAQTGAGGVPITLTTPPPCTP